MRVARTIALLVGAWLLAAPAFAADRAPLPGPELPAPTTSKLPGVRTQVLDATEAVAISIATPVLGTLAGTALMMAGAQAPGLVVASVGLVVGPSLGHLGAGMPARALPYMALRGGALAMALVGGQLARAGNADLDNADNLAIVGTVFAAVGTVGMVAGAAAGIIAVHAALSEPPQWGPRIRITPWSPIARDAPVFGASVTVDGW